MFKGDLYNKAVQARIEFPSARGDAAIALYLDLRIYMLFALMFGVPPQRCQVFEVIKTTDVTYSGDYTVFAIATHKTSAKYGDAVVVLPPFYKEFKAFVNAPDELAKFDDKTLFIGRDGKPEDHITQRFRAIVYKYFNAIVTICDCRTLYVAYALQRCDLKQLYELSRQMCHSFQTQQNIYRADTNLQRAFQQIENASNFEG